MNRLPITVLCLAGACSLFAQPAQLANTAPLESNPDFSATMVAGVDKFLLREIEAAKGKRGGYWKRDVSSPEAYAQSLATNREHLREIIGAIDPRLPVTQLEVVSNTERGPILAETD